MVRASAARADADVQRYQIERPGRRRMCAAARGRSYVIDMQLHFVGVRRCPVQPSRAGPGKSKYFSNNGAVQSATLRQTIWNNTAAIKPCIKLPEMTYTMAPINV